MTLDKIRDALRAGYPMFADGNRGGAGVAQLRDTYDAGLAECSDAEQAIDALRQIVAYRLDTQMSTEESVAKARYEMREIARAALARLDRKDTT